MKTMNVFLTVATLTLMLLGCAQEQKQSQTYQSPEQSQIPRGTVLVKHLPAGAEGVELSGGSLRLKSGYTFVKQPRHGFAIARMGGGQPVTSGGCGCTGGTCDPVFKGGIIVCEDKGGCTGTCGLALTVFGVRTQIIRY